MDLVQRTPRLLAGEPLLAAAEMGEHRVWLENYRRRKVEVCVRRTCRDEFSRLHSRIVAARVEPLQHGPHEETG